MDRERIESLHEKASGHYLQGEYPAALSAWEELLGLSPDDERAQEGIRLCRLMAEPGETAPQEPEASAEAGVLDVGDELDAALSALDTQAAPDEGPAGADASTSPGSDIFEEVGEPAVETEGAGELDLGFDLGSLEDEEEPPIVLDAGSSLDEEQDMEVMLLDHEEASPETAPPSAEAEEEAPAPAGLEPVADNPAVQELQRRINELLEDAKTAASENRADDALGILARLFILDENHAEAQALEESIRSGMEGAAREIDSKIEEGVQVLETGDREQARLIFEEILEVAPDHREAKHYLEKIDADQGGEGDEDALPLGEFAPAGSEEAIQEHGAVDLPGSEGEAVGVDGAPAGAPADGGAPGFADLLHPEELATDEEPEVAETPLQEAAPAKEKKRSGRPVLVLALVVAIAAVGAYGWFFTDWIRPQPGSGEPGGAATAAASPAQDSGSGPVAADENVSGGERTTEELLAQAEQLTRAANVSTTPSDPVQARSAIERAEAALEAGDISEAILAYNEALDADPDNGRAQRGLQEAGRRFRVQQKQLRDLERALDSFRAGDYESALRALYRLPDGLEPDRVEQAKVASWYNLGLVHLRAGETDEAIEYFNEALGIREDDSEILEARSLAERYRNLVHDRSYYAKAEGFEFRALD